MSSTVERPWFWNHLRKSRVRIPQFQSTYHYSAPSPSSLSDEEVLEDNSPLLEKATSSSHLPGSQRQPVWLRLQRNNACSLTIAVLVSAIFSAAATFALIYLISHQSVLSNAEPVHGGKAELNAPFQPIPRLRHCGTTAEEARSLGCKFQIWSYSWVPPECYDEELVQDWLAMRDWEYYDDRYGQGKVVNFTTEVLQGEGDRLLYSTWGQHYWHCAFSWRKFLRSALGSGVGITDQDLDYHHANHCQDTIRNKPDYRPWDENDIQLTVGFHRC